jgi:hypothetical protein
MGKIGVLKDGSEGTATALPHFSTPIAFGANHAIRPDEPFGEALP